MLRFLAWLLTASAVGSATAAAQSLIVIDPGHGGSDPGAVGCGLREAPMALDVAKRLERLLEDAGLRVRMTRSDDTYVPLAGRTTMANDAGADRFVSIHNNAHSSSASGTETFMYTSGSSASRDLRDRIQRAMISAWMLPDRGGKTDEFYVLKYTSMPATLSELAFISRCSPDAELIGDPDARQEAAQAHFLAITEHLGVDPMPPPMDGTIAGVVYEDVGFGEEDTSRRLAGARVTLLETEATVDATAESAEFSFTVPPGTYTIRAESDGYQTGERTCTLEGGSVLCPLGLAPVEAVGDAGAEPHADAGDVSDAGRVGSLHDAGMERIAPRASKLHGDGCSASGARAEWLCWVLVAWLWGLRRGLGRRRWGVAMLLGAVLWGLVGCDRGAPAGSKGMELEEGVHGGEGRVVRGPSDPVEAASVESFAELAGDRVVLAEELGAAVLSPDGERVALTPPGHRGLRIVEVATGREVTVTEEPRSGWLPVWRDDGLAIAYRAPGQSGSAVPMHAVTIDGRSLLPFVRTSDVHFVERHERIVRLHDDGRAARVSPDLEGERFVAPLRSPDGRHVVFHGLSSGLYVHRVADGRTVALGAGAQPSFSADGQWLVFARADDDGHRITASDLYLTYLDHDAYPTGQLTHTPERIELSPSLDATATRLAYLDERTQELHLAALELTDTDALDAPGTRARPHVHRVGAPPHAHPHVDPGDGWHLMLGH